MRVPYDDEWFSLELAHDPSTSQLWAALAGDIHPPWLALLDRALAQLGPGALWLQGPRVAWSAAALALTSGVLARRLHVPRGLCLLAGLHPIVLFYAGAARWYPLLLLAHALRLAGVWHARPAERTSAVLFLCGSALGSLATYLDPLFLVHDALWLALRSVRAGVRPGRLRAVLIGAALACALTFWASPLPLPLAPGGAAWLPSWRMRDVAAWGLLGMAGEAALAWPWWTLGAASVLASSLGVLRALRDPSSRPLAIWLGTYAGCWFLACGFGVDHPRCSLLLWAVLPCFWLRWLLPTAAPDAGHERLLRGLAVVSWVHLSVGLGLVISGHGFFKADLNELDAEDCAPLRAAASARAVFVSYARLDYLVRKQCNTPLPLVRLPAIRIVPNPDQQLAAVHHWLEGGGQLWLLSVNTQVSYARTAERVRAALQTRCRLQSSTDFARIPHPGLSAQRADGYRRFKLEQFGCSRSTP